MAKDVKLADIAKLAGVSTVTVSKALAGQKGVSEKMRAKIEELADELGYVRMSSEKKSDEKTGYMIVTVVAERYLQENQSFYWQIYQEIAQRTIACNCFTMLEVISHEDEKSCALPQSVLRQKADGMIIMGNFKKAYINHLVKSVKMPHVFLDSTYTDGNCDAVVSNNVLGGYVMTNYLYNLGHKNIGFVGTLLSTSSIDDRYLGYVKSTLEHGGKISEELVLSDRDREIGKVDLDKYLKFPEKMPTAFFCNCDYTASILIKKLNDMGYRVPEDISVVGFDNYLNEQLPGLGITTYEIDTKAMAKRVIHIIEHKLRNANYSTGVFTLGGKFIEGDTAKRIAEPVPGV